MENFAYQLNQALPVLYGITTAAYLVLFMSNGARLASLSRVALLLSIAVHIAFMAVRVAGEHHIPLASQSEALSFFALAVAVVYIYLELRLGTSITGVFVLFVVFVFQLISTSMYGPFTPINPILRSGWFAFHAGSAVLSFSAFAVAALFAAMYLLLVREINARKPGYIFQRIPSLELLDEMSYKSVMLGFLLFTAGIGSGVIWADQAWGKFWSWDPKQVSSLVVWLVYAAYLHARLQRGWEGKRVAVFAAVGFVVLVFTFVFVDLLFNTVHRFI